MSGTFPSSPPPSSMIPRSVQPTLMSEAHSLKQQVRTRGGQRWGFKLTWDILKRTEYASIWSFLIAQRGRFETFQFTIPVLGNRRASGASAVTVQTATTSGNTVPVTGATAGEQVGLNGDFLKFANHTKVYMLTADAIADGTGKASLSIEPALYASVALGEAVTLDNVTITVRRIADTLDLPDVRSAAVVSNFTDEFMEAL